MANPAPQVVAPVAANMNPSYPMASLYVGDLHPDVSEAQLFEKFSSAGPVLSIRVCRDAITRRSLGYAYVNFQQPADAERALDTMNFDVMNSKPIRIMWSQRDPAMRRSGAGNIFIKNLDKGIDTKSIYDTFSMFGSILSCKVAQDEEGNSKGYGFIHFETEEAAQKAIDKVNGMLLEGKKVFVGKFQARAARLREMGETTRRFTNVFVKNFGEELTKEKLEEMFGKYGSITSCAVMSDDEGKSKGFGFVAFERSEDAEKAVTEMNDFEILSDRKLVVCRAQKKSERQAELKRRYEVQKSERMQRYQGVNLYVKNLDDSVDDDALRQHFEGFGNITSAKVMCDENARSKGFGFVCFEKPDDATKAVTEMNNKMLGSKPLYVALAQRKEDRKAQLASQYMQRLASIRMHNNGMPGTMYTPNAGYFVSSGIQNQRPAFMPTAAIQNAPMRAGAPRWNAMNATAGFGAVQSPYMVQSGAYGGQIGRRPGPGNGGMRGQQGQNANYQGGNARGGPQNRMQGGAMSQGQPGVRPPVGQMGSKGQQSMYPPQYMGAARQNAPAMVIEPLTTQLLAQANPQEQKQLLGERIYPLIQRFCDEVDVGKITGMMLEMDNSELLMMLENEELLRAKVNEASVVLKSSKTN
ncbi:hypothetical protein QR680_017529 [Steinernema hermaphroditum]|uniref:Polyadenylate-binding protein n=1 Tax=Steinernema hermaphroditum TaxID=289476 RepID=A0AA39HHA8_9BILA|nr:hypothetical protein QR680_017529 [Steinernema hermaphroditum]